MIGYNGFGNDSHCVILINGEETDITPTTFNEVSKGGSTHLCTLYSSDTNLPERDISVRKFGANSWFFPSTAAAKGIVVGSGLHDDWTIGSDDFTIDYWAYSSNSYITSGTQFSLIAGVYLDASNYWGIFYDITGGSPATVRYRFISRRAGVDSINLDYALSVTASTFNHFAVTKKGSTITLYLNGVSQTSGSLAAIDTISSSFKVGALVDTDSFDREWRIDEFRLSKGISRWNSNFTVPNRAY